ncbi:uncharacterized protein B0I36DRAFT_356627 [Microdochium trichocladiopsis]|uniref:Uncharacterized protein n=1 Tax=Microdochium trichocladiopsis TaxID=1682393 RepID=A0A9P8XPU7_9PEZI|nr:uncharacterized protein B0I36DRAFT_356627 [Microdochium trichocladiopsis]KAH7009384.1 hypothetical protein B0I36DRAFT_356627 [Microdochium trichocladiopsis]
MIPVFRREPMPEKVWHTVAGVAIVLRPHSGSQADLENILNTRDCKTGHWLEKVMEISFEPGTGTDTARLFSENACPPSMPPFVSESMSIEVEIKEDETTEETKEVLIDLKFRKAPDNGIRPDSSWPCLRPEEPFSLSHWEQIPGVQLQLESNHCYLIEELLTTKSLKLYIDILPKKLCNETEQSEPHRLEREEGLEAETSQQLADDGTIERDSEQTRYLNVTICGPYSGADEIGDLMEAHVLYLQDPSTKHEDILYYNPQRLYRNLRKLSEWWETGSGGVWKELGGRT